ncbi:MAG: exodeoxyribonuclease VII small subunit [Propionibacterium sp.]|nr:exodeoxyribonuclease VII small subunit [Propionibacterium sp.]
MSEPELSYEEARDELRTIVQKMESGQAPLAESLALWERGEQLATICRQWLDGADERINAARRAIQPEENPTPPTG